MAEKIQHTAVTVPNVLTFGECPSIRHDKGKLHLIIAQKCVIFRIVGVIPFLPRPVFRHSSRFLGNIFIICLLHQPVKFGEGVGCLVLKDNAFAPFAENIGKLTGRIGRLTGLSRSHGRLPHQRRGGEHGGVLGGGNGHGGGGGKFFDLRPHILRQTVLIEFNSSVGSDMGDSLVIAVSQFQPVPHRHAVAQVPKAQVITGGVRLYGFDGGNPLRKGLFRTFPDIIVDTQRINGIS